MCRRAVPPPWSINKKSQAIDEAGQIAKMIMSPERYPTQLEKAGSYWFPILKNYLSIEFFTKDTWNKQITENIVPWTLPGNADGGLNPIYDDIGISATKDMLQAIVVQNKTPQEAIKLLADAAAKAKEKFKKQRERWAVSERRNLAGRHDAHRSLALPAVVPARNRYGNTLDQPFPGGGRAGGGTTPSLAARRGARLCAPGPGGRPDPPPRRLPLCPRPLAQLPQEIAGVRPMRPGSGWATTMPWCTTGVFWLAVPRMSFVFTSSSVALKLILGLTIALILNEALPLRNLWRAIVLLPYAMPTLVSVLIWKWMFNDTGGVLNYLLKQTSIRENGRCSGSPIRARRWAR